MLPFSAMLQSQEVSPRDYLTPAQFATLTGMSEKEVLQRIANGRNQGKWDVIRKKVRNFLTGEPIEVIYIPMKEARKQYDHIRAVTAHWWGWAIPNHYSH